MPYCLATHLVYMALATARVCATTAKIALAKKICIITTSHCDVFTRIYLIQVSHGHNIKSKLNKILIYIKPKTNIKIIIKPRVSIRILTLIKPHSYIK